MNLYFNKKNTKYLIKASYDEMPMTKIKLDWGIENKNKIFGCIKKRWFKEQILFLINKEKDKYRLICYCNKNTYFYLIEDIDEFLDFIHIEELSLEEATDMEKTQLIDTLAITKTLPFTGIAKIQNNRVFLFDCVGE